MINYQVKTFLENRHCFAFLTAQSRYACGDLVRHDIFGVSRRMAPAHGFRHAVYHLRPVHRSHGIALPCETAGAGGGEATQGRDYSSSARSPNYILGRQEGLQRINHQPKPSVEHRFASHVFDPECVTHRHIWTQLDTFGVFGRMTQTHGPSTRGGSMGTRHRPTLSTQGSTQAIHAQAPPNTTCDWC